MTITRSSAAMTEAVPEPDADAQPPDEPTVALDLLAEREADCTMATGRPETD